jgi:hypothetical protein
MKAMVHYEHEKIKRQTVEKELKAYLKNSEGIKKVD